MLLSLLMSGLRERKKQRTREQIIESAFELFRERGYVGTTIADIAEAAEISPRTFFSYFPSKEAVVFHNFDDILESVQASVVDRADGKSTIDTLRGWVGVELSPDQRIRDQEALRVRMCREDPGLAAYQQHNQAKFTDVLREGIARDLGEPPDSLHPKLVAASIMAALVAIGDENPSKPRALALFDEALVFLRGGVAALSAARAAN
jgi:AcrR family transcriptional regulator